MLMAFVPCGRLQRYSTESATAHVPFVVAEEVAGWR